MSGECVPPFLMQERYPSGQHFQHKYRKCVDAIVGSRSRDEMKSISSHLGRLEISLFLLSYHYMKVKMIRFIFCFNDLQLTARAFIIPGIWPCTNLPYISTFVSLYLLYSCFKWGENWF